MTISKLEDDKFYEHEREGGIRCGKCWSEDILDTRTGSLQGDERVYIGDLIYIEDQDDEGYQCDDCLKQNDAYDNDD